MSLILVLPATPQAAKALFGESRLPTLVQYDPCTRFFEVEDGNLLFSGNNGVPLIRYNICDQGGLITYAEIMEFLANWNFDPITELENHRGIRQLPFVYVFVSDWKDEGELMTEYRGSVHIFAGSSINEY